MSGQVVPGTAEWAEMSSHFSEGHLRDWEEVSFSRMRGSSQALTSIGIQGGGSAAPQGSCGTFGMAGECASLCCPAGTLGAQMAAG